MRKSKMNPKPLKKQPVLDPSFAYLLGVLAGDGHIGKSKSKDGRFKDYRISIELSDYSFLKKIELIIKEYVETKSSVREVKKREGKMQSWVFQFRNKAFYTFLTEEIGLPIGSKDKLTVPDSIKKGSIEIKKGFIAGLFDTDGGSRGDVIGFTMKNEAFQKDMSSLLDDIKISNIKERWLNKKYNLFYYGIKIKRSRTATFLNELPLRNDEKRNRNLNKFNAELPKWSNGAEE